MDEKYKELNEQKALRTREFVTKTIELLNKYKEEIVSPLVADNKTEDELKELDEKYRNTMVTIASELMADSEIKKGEIEFATQITSGLFNSIGQIIKMSVAEAERETLSYLYGAVDVDGKPDVSFATLGEIKTKLDELKK